jgi:hypothetical protein
VQWDRVATLRVDRTHFEVEGDQDFAEVRAVELLDVHSGQTVTSSSRAG